jgi:hypothetical protein
MVKKQQNSPLISKTMKNITPEELANKWINEMIEFGLEPEQMLQVLELAREKLKFLKEAEKIKH